MNLTLLIHGKTTSSNQKDDPESSIRITPKGLIRYMVDEILVPDVTTEKTKLEDLLPPEACTEFLQTLGTWLETEQAKQPFPETFRMGIDCILVKALGDFNPDLSDPETASEINEIIIAGIHPGHSQTPCDMIRKAPGIPILHQAIGFFQRLINQNNGPSGETLVKTALRSAYENTFGAPVEKVQAEKGEVTETGTPESPGSEEEDESPYCKECGSCGESGCCNPTGCKTVILNGTYCKGMLRDYKEMEKEFCDMAEIFARAAKKNPEDKAMQEELQKVAQLAPWILKED